MVMLMIKFGAYKAAGVVGCVLPPFAQTTKLMTMRKRGRAFRKCKKSGFRTTLPPLLLFFFPQFFPSLSPSPRRSSFFSVY